MTNATVKYPDITVQLVGRDGNAFAILGNVQRALRNAGVPAEAVKEYMDEATAGDYNHLLGVTTQWVDVS